MGGDDPPMRHFHVKVYFAHCAGSAFVEARDSYITFARAYVVNGVFVSEDWAELEFTPFGSLRLSPPDDDRHPAVVDPYRDFLDSLTPDDVLEDSTHEHPIIPVSSFEFIEGNWFDQPEADDIGTAIQERTAA